jgi:hypothetical protein
LLYVEFENRHMSIVIARKESATVPLILTPSYNALGLSLHFLRSYRYYLHPMG